MPANQRSVMVTGASTGIGRACVAELVRRGHHVWAAVRTDDDERTLLRDHPERVSVLRLDLTDEQSVREAGKRVCDGGPLHGLVNNAGVALPGPLEYLPIDVLRRQLEINLVGQLLTTQVTLPALRRARAQGDTARIVMIGSIAGRVAGPMLGAYHTAKFGLAGLSDSLRAELAPSGIGVVLIEPGAVATPIWNRGISAADELLATAPEAAQRYAGQIEAARQNAAKSAARGIAPERAARIIATALTAARPRPRRVVGPDAAVAATLARLLPYRLLYRLMAGRGAAG